ncbi:P-II family nitrogen regulator [Pectinatus frisingensis]|uniref:P-II family nitrogen regulator n=1 Tax=Pectinatus frisingensis TaxID=865 RepID=UPI0018C626FC|nr:P-II family nitrogen regulator [Pectinatus frisingensis]
MKEITAVIRMEKIGSTKKALLDIGIPGFTAFKAEGRGRLVTDKNLLAKRKLSIVSMNSANSGSDVLMTEFVNGTKIFPCRVIIVLAADKDADKIIRAIIGANRTDYGIGDGKIFVAPLDEAIRVRTRETGDAAL